MSEPSATDDEVLRVARAHGSTVAAAWSGRSPTSVVVLRKRADGYDRGRGRPSLAEVAARSFRWDCGCPRCIDQRDDEAADLNRRYASTDPHRPERADDAWRDQAACRPLATALFFPRRGQVVDALAVQACASCPVHAECLAWALDNENFGYWAGTSERARRILRRSRSVA